MYRYLAVRPQARDGAVRLLCFHHAGAGAMSFAGWQRRAGDGVEVLPVRLPGREALRREPAVTDADRLTELLDADLGPLLDEAPYAFYGHSMGALVAYRLALHRLRRAARTPLLLLVGACPAPQLPSRLLDGADPGTMSDGTLMTVMDDEQSLPQAVRAHPDRLARTLGVLRGDLRLAASLRTAPVVELPLPVAAFAGRDDRIVQPGDVRAWQRCTGVGFAYRELAGAHFFVRGRELPRHAAAAVRSAVTPRPVPVPAPLPVPVP
ncbi:thioesterase II family protein [Streptomyces sp. NPDC056190]|uniref:thioesterase II family protein n=1 Tax=Streptomyces sp. NPDC056190 TaxID=3345741 RepID=UPI0035DA8483